MTYEVQQYTLCQGWVNTWTVHEPDGSSKPETFATAEDAAAALAAFLAEIDAEIAAGDRAPDEGYDAGEFRIVPVAS